MSEFQEIKKYKIDSNILERYTIDKICRPSTSASFEFENGEIEINCRSSTGVGLIEHVIAEDEDDFDNSIPTISVSANSQVIEIVPDDIAEPEENAFRDVETCSKWTPSDTLAFLEAIKEVLVKEEVSGGYLSRKSIFEKVAQLLKANGFSISSSDAEKKYNNMLVTYRRCQKRLMLKKQAPLWPYFKLFEEIRNKDIEINNIPSEVVSRKKKLNISNQPLLMRRKQVCASEDPGTRIKDPSGWKANRNRLNQRKQLLIEQLMASTRTGRKTDENLRLTLREADEIEIEYLNAVKLEVHKTTEVLIGGVNAFKTSLTKLRDFLVRKE